MPFTADDLIATRLEFGGVELKGGGLGHHIVARNLRAAAHVELGEWVKAEEDLTWVLTHDPHNQTATANLCACLSRQKRWTDLLTVVECGLKDATDTTRRQLLVSEAAALEELGDSQLAALSLRAAGDAALEEGGASEVTRRVLSGAALLRGQQIPVERILYCEGEDDIGRCSLLQVRVSGRNSSRVDCSCCQASF